MRSCRSCCFTHSWPSRQILTGYGRYVPIFHAQTAATLLSVPLRGPPVFALESSRSLVGELRRATRDPVSVWTAEAGIVGAGNRACSDIERFCPTTEQHWATPSGQHLMASAWSPVISPYMCWHSCWVHISPWSPVTPRRTDCRRELPLSPVPASF
jgi:hypothetical protein